MTMRTKEEAWTLSGAATGIRIEQVSWIVPEVLNLVQQMVFCCLYVCVYVHKQLQQIAKAGTLLLLPRST